MTHGWPGSVIDLHGSIGPLTDPTACGGQAEDALHLVLPSLPGYSFSSEPAEFGWDAARTARTWAVLMERLGYTRYVAQGGDVGTLVKYLMGRQRTRIVQDGFGDFLEMATRPQTISYALLDSPIALAAWLLDHDTDS